MPNQPQEPLSPLRASGTALFSPSPTAAPGTIAVLIAGSEIMTYYGGHTWFCNIQGPPLENQELNILFTLFLDWQNSKTSLNIQAYAYPTENYPGDTAYLELDTCDATSPWQTGPQSWSGYSGYASGTIQAARNLSPLAPLLPMFVSSPTVHGVTGDHCVYRGPLYPEGAVYGETPPNGYGTRLRRRATNVVYTDAGQAARRVNFQSAAEQWQTLSPAEQADWNAAGRSVKPPATGYALWTQIIATRRTDRIPTLNARTGKTLVVPDFPA